MLALNPTHVIVMVGTNDAFARLPLSVVAANFEAMESACGKIQPIFGLPIPSIFPSEEAFLCDYREWLDTYAKAANIPVIDFYTPFYRELKASGSGELLADGVHPSLAGYRLMAETASRFHVPR